MDKYAHIHEYSANGVKFNMKPQSLECNCYQNRLLGHHDTDGSQFDIYLKKDKSFTTGKH